jgi:hypothetical protein
VRRYTTTGLIEQVHVITPVKPHTSKVGVDTIGISSIELGGITETTYCRLQTSGQTKANKQLASTTRMAGPLFDNSGPDHDPRVSPPK